MQMNETEVLGELIGRKKNYGVSAINHLHGQCYSITMEGEQHLAVVLTTSFQYYEKRYHIADVEPTLVVCWQHDSVLPVPVLSVRAGNYAASFELPENITDMEAQRHTKVGSQVLLGAYISGVRAAQVIVNNLPPSTKGRYFQRAKALCKRKRGRPAGLVPINYCLELQGLRIRYD